MMFNFVLIVLTLSVLYPSMEGFTLGKSSHYLTKRSDYSGNGGGGSNDYGDIEETEDSYIIPARYFNKEQLKQICEYCDTADANQKMQCDKNTNSNAGSYNGASLPISTAIDNINAASQAFYFDCSGINAANNAKVNIDLSYLADVLSL